MFFFSFMFLGSSGWLSNQIDTRLISQRKYPYLLCMYIWEFHKNMGPERTNQAVKAYMPFWTKEEEAGPSNIW